MDRWVSEELRALLAKQTVYVNLRIYVERKFYITTTFLLRSKKHLFLMVIFALFCLLFSFLFFSFFVCLSVWEIKSCSNSLSIFGVVHVRWKLWKLGKECNAISGEILGYSSEVQFILQKQIFLLLITRPLKSCSVLSLLVCLFSLLLIHIVMFPSWVRAIHSYLQVMLPTLQWSS